ALGAALLLVGPQALWAQDDTADAPVSTSAAGGSQMLRSTRSGQRVTVDSLARDSVQASTFAFDQDTFRSMLGLVRRLHEPQAMHVDQQALLNLVQAGNGMEAFLEAFEGGDGLFGTTFNALDGVGANVGNGMRFTRVPRADLNGPNQWAQLTPTRVTGPNGSSCAECHLQPVEDGSGPAAVNVIRDPLRQGNVGKMVNRNTPHIFGLAGPQRLAEEMTDTLQGIRAQAIRDARRGGQAVTRRLEAKGVRYGFITARPNGTADTSRVQGVSTDLVVRPFQWKGNFAFTREFNRDASNQELGMGPVETTGFGVDGDHDGVVDEMSIGDQTALAVYTAAQPRPTSRVELAALGLIPPLTAQETASIGNGTQVFSDVGCASCHKPALLVDNVTYSEPSQNPNFRDSVFPAGFTPVSVGVTPQFPVTFDITQDQPNNQIVDAAGNVVFRLGSFEKNAQGQAIIRLYGDLKRHDMGNNLAEDVDEIGNGPSVFLTRSLWGVGSTPPYLHDGRATTLSEAILFHGGEAADARNRFRQLQTQDQADLITFLNNLVLFVLPEE
ncbi:MAG TPA: di-heme oxidoredictase family protein, partial [bacterium]